MDKGTPPSQPVIPVSNQHPTLDPNQLSKPGESQSVPQAAPVAQSQPVATPPPQPQYPVSGPNKEAAPIPTAPVHEYVRPTEVTPQLPPEVQEAGVEVVENKERLQLTSDHQAVGIQLAREAVPVVIPQNPSITLPYTATQVNEIEKTTPVSDSRHWLAVLTEYIMKKLQGVST